MTSKLRLLPLTILACAALAFAACGGSSSSDDAAPAGTDAPAGGNLAPNTDDDLFVSNGTEVLGRSSTAFSSTDIHSLTGETNFSFQLGTTKLGEKSTFASEDPDRFYMEMTMDTGDDTGLGSLLSGFGDMKMLSRDGTFYMYFLGQWMSFTTEDLGADSADIEEMLNTGSVFDYTKFIENNANVTYVNDETVNGHETARYKFQGTVKDLVSAFTDASGSDASLEDALAEVGDMPVTIDLWIGKSDFLPYQLEMSTSQNTAQGHFELNGTTTFDNYNESVDIPDAPSDAVSLSDFFGGLFASPTPAP